MRFLGSEKIINKVKSLLSFRFSKKKIPLYRSDRKFPKILGKIPEIRLIPSTLQCDNIHLIIS